MSLLCPNYAFVCTIAEFVHSCVYIVGVVRPIIVASHAVLHAAFRKGIQLVAVVIIMYEACL